MESPFASLNCLGTETNGAMCDLDAATSRKTMMSSPMVKAVKWSRLVDTDGTTTVRDGVLVAAEVEGGRSG